MDSGFKGPHDLIERKILAQIFRENDLFFCTWLSSLKDWVVQEAGKNNFILLFFCPFFAESKECSNLYFCFRWLLIWFKREFTMDDICRVWEVKSSLVMSSSSRLGCILLHCDLGYVLHSGHLGFNAHKAMWIIMRLISNIVWCLKCGNTITILLHIDLGYALHSVHLGFKGS